MTARLLVPARPSSGRSSQGIEQFVSRSRERLAEMMAGLDEWNRREHAIWVCRRVARQVTRDALTAKCRAIARFTRTMGRFVRRVDAHALPFGRSQRALLRRAAFALRDAIEQVAKGDVDAQPMPALQVLLEVWARMPGKQGKAS
jgi:hypothetical protein